MSVDLFGKSVEALSILRREPALTRRERDALSMPRSSASWVRIMPFFRKALFKRRSCFSAICVSFLRYLYIIAYVLKVLLGRADSAEVCLSEDCVTTWHYNGIRSLDYKA